MTFLRCVNGATLKEMVLSGIKLLEQNKASIDALNVFPVPDGDTGTNMSLTMVSAAKELGKIESDEIGTVAAAIARGALMGARGNSGVILSQLYRGFSKGLEGLSEADADQFAHALALGAEAAYKAVMKPKEGTILTVAREIAEAAVLYAQEDGDLYGLFEKIIQCGEASLKRTPDLLPPLKKAGVVDSGGMGLLVIYMGYKAALDGETIEDVDALLGLSGPAEPIQMQADEEITFGYCTEFLIPQTKEGVAERHIERLREKLSKLGDCVLVVGDATTVKVHLHSNDPGVALQYGLMLGALSSIKIDNMREQHRHLIVEEADEVSGIEGMHEMAQEGERAEYAIVSVCAGDGIAGLMKDLGAAQVVTGGQTMNPSTQDLLDAAKRTKAKVVFLLPNNPNIILAAQQAAEIAQGQTLCVVPTRTIPQGVAALVAFLPDREFDENMKAMQEAAQAIRSGAVTYAVRDSEVDGHVVKEGDILGLDGKRLKVIGKEIAQVVKDLLSDMLAAQEGYLATLYYGEDVTPEEAADLALEITQAHEDIEVEIVQGKQPLYYYYLSLE